MRNRNASAGLSLVHSRQAVGTMDLRQGLSRMQVMRIREALAAGRAERKIAESEQISERAVIKVRTAELDRLGRHGAAVGVVARGLVDEFATLTREIDDSVLAELTEAA